MSSSAKSICLPSSVPERARLSASLASTRLQDDPLLLFSVAVFTPREWSANPTAPAGGDGVDDSVTSAVAGLSDAAHFLERMRCVTVAWPDPVGGSNRKKSASPAMWSRSTPPPVMGTGGGPFVPEATAPGSTTAARANPDSATTTFVLVLITGPLPSLRRHRATADERRAGAPAQTGEDRPRRRATPAAVTLRGGTAP